jgi:hypothetical protein
MHTESPTIKIEVIHREKITERPRPYVPQEPPLAEVVPCHRCGRPMDAIRQKDAGYLIPIAQKPGHEDGEVILGYACMNRDCLDGAFDERS